MFNHYYPDNEVNINDTIDKIIKTEYIILSSKRLYLSIPRLPKRFPSTIVYYEKLFSGELGFDLIKSFTSYPNIFGIEFNDDDAEEPFTVYDHPKVLIYKKGNDFDAEKVRAMLSGHPDGVIELLTLGAEGKAGAKDTKKSLMLSKEIKDANRQADNQQYFVLNELSQATIDLGPIQVPVAALIWWLAIELLGLAVFPLLFLLLSTFKDRGYSLTKIFGILIPAWIVWLLGSFRIAPFSFETILITGVATLLFSAIFSSTLSLRKNLNLFIKKK